MLRSHGFSRPVTIEGLSVEDVTFPRFGGHRGRSQGLGNELIEPKSSRPGGEVVCRERLGGLLKHYERAA